MKWRIEITRDRWTRVQIAGRGSERCPRCGTVLNLASVDELVRAGVSRTELQTAILTAAVLAWESSGAGQLVCVRCVLELIAGREP
jgi:hypothetical protein